MNGEINLVTKKRTNEKNAKRLFIGSVVVFGFIFLLAVLIVGYVFLLKSNLSSLDTQEQNVKAKILSFEAKKNKALITKDRLLSINALLKLRKNFDGKLEPIISLIPPTLAITALSATDEKVQLTIATSDISALDSLLEEQLNSRGKNIPKEVRRIDLGSFSQNDEGYLMSLNFYFTVPKSVNTPSSINQP